MNRKEYNRCVDELADRLYTYALHMIQHSMEAEDIVQESFLKLWTKRKVVESRTAKAYMYKMVHNACLDFFKLKKHSMLDTSSLENILVITEKSNYESQDYIRNLLQDMDPQARALLLLRDYEGYSYDEIGNLMDLSSAQVKVYLFRARKKVQAMAKSKNYS